MLRREVAKLRPVSPPAPSQKGALVRDLATLLMQSNGYPLRVSLNTIAAPGVAVVLDLTAVYISDPLPIPGRDRGRDGAGL